VKEPLTHPRVGSETFGWGNSTQRRGKRTGFGPGGILTNIRRPLDIMCLNVSLRTVTPATSSRYLPDPKNVREPFVSSEALWGEYGAHAPPKLKSQGVGVGEERKQDLLFGAHSGEQKLGEKILGTKANL